MSYTKPHVKSLSVPMSLLPSYVIYSLLLANYPIAPYYVTSYSVATKTFKGKEVT